MGFEWRTDDEESTPPGWRDEKRMRRVRRPRWIWYIVMLIVAAGAVAYLWRLAERRIDASVSQLEADVRLSQSLVERAAATDDPELLRTVLSGRDDEWAETQRELLAAGKGYTGIARLFGLEPVGAPAEQSLTLNAELRSAELVVTQRYTPTLLSPVSEPAVLEHTYVFRRGANRWLLAPPEPDFWGPKHSLQTAVATVNFPERDGSIVRRLASDLVADVDSLCAQLPRGCPDDLHMTITFASGIDSIAHYEDGRAMLASGTEITLPSPSLLGIPRDDAGYAAMHSGYARYLLSTVLPLATGWECCERVLYRQALLQARLNQLGLAAPLLSPAEALDILELVSDPNDYYILLSQKWQSRNAASLATPLPLDVRTLVAYLLAPPQAVAGQPGASLEELESRLQEVSSFRSWLSAFTAVEPGEEWELRSPLIRLAQNLYEAPPRPPDLKLPDQGLLAACGAQGEQVWRYDLQSDAWAKEIDLGSETAFSIVTSDDTYYVAGLNFYESGDSFPRFRLLRKRPGEPAETVAEEDAIFWIPLAKHGESIPIVLVELEDADEPQLGMLDLASCRTGDCHWEETPGFVEYSPGGAYELASAAVIGGDLALRLRADGEAWQDVAEGVFPVWLDDNTFAYLQGEQSSGFSRLMVQDVAGQSAVLTDVETVRQTINRPGLNSLTVAVVTPAVPGAIFLVATAGGETYVLELSRPATGTWLSADVATASVQAQQEGEPVFELFPHVGAGRWLVIQLRETGPETGPHYWLVDLVGEYPPVSLRSTLEQTFFMPGYDWSENGAWMAWAGRGGVNLIAPGSSTDDGPYELWLPFAETQCIMVAWVG
jgi:hypothetical protein